MLDLEAVSVEADREATGVERPCVVADALGVGVHRLRVDHVPGDDDVRALVAVSVEPSPIARDMHGDRALVSRVRQARRAAWISEHDRVGEPHVFGRQRPNVEVEGDAGVARIRRRPAIRPCVGVDVEAERRNLRLALPELVLEREADRLIDGAILRVAHSTDHDDATRLVGGPLTPQRQRSRAALERVALRDERRYVGREDGVDGDAALVQRRIKHLDLAAHLHVLEDALVVDRPVVAGHVEVCRREAQRLPAELEVKEPILRRHSSSSIRTRARR